MKRDADRDAALALYPVSRETRERLQTFVDLLDRWRRVVNLVSDSSSHRIWTRHVVDSAQLLRLAPEARIWIDLGSGAGFPGLVIAIQLAEAKGARVHLIESDRRKSAFLREAARATGAPAVVHNSRIEDAGALFAGPVDAVTARALAPLPRLIPLATLWLDRGAIGVFPLGRKIELDFTVIQKLSDYAFSFTESLVNRESHILIVRRKKLAGDR